MRFLSAALVLLLAFSSALAEDVAVVFDDSKPGTYLVTVAPGGGVSASPLRVVRVGSAPNPPTEPPTNPPTTDTALQLQVKVLTRAAITAGGKPETAARLAGVYALVSDYCLDGTVSPELVRGTTEKPGLLSQATDAVLKDASDKAAWTAWRQGVGTELALRHPATPSKDALAATLREVSSAVKSHLGTQVEAGILDKIDWQAIIELLRPIIRDLLLKLLTDLINKK